MNTQTKTMAIFFFAAFFSANQNIIQAQTNPESSLGWELGVQTWSFNRFTLAEALDKVDSLGVKYIQAYPGQKIGGGIEGSFDYKNIDKATQSQVLDLLKRKGVELISYGVVSPNNENDWQKLFEFAKDMNLQSIATEPSFNFLPLIAKLAEQYKIKVALHNHPKPTRYWSPDTTMAALKLANSKYVGVNADIGHWVRSGLNPVDCLKQLEGHIFALHLKDLSEKSRNAHDVVWGTGVSDIDGIITELKRQKFKGAIFAEYEYHWEYNTEEIAMSVKNIREKIKRTQ